MRTDTLVESKPKANLLQNTLRGNAAFSVISGLAFIFAARPLSEFVGLPYPWAFVVIGVILLPFAYIVYQTAMKSPVNEKGATAIIEMDIAWVIGSFILLVVLWSTLTVAGRWFLFLQAEAVATFALFQFIGLRRIKKGG
ncbi:MAG: hypothetical protein GY943_25120 [Chloroflexi bacterium]|nr:hypothetical protein [Chloroflexota bacterium]